MRLQLVDPISQKGQVGHEKGCQSIFSVNNEFLKYFYSENSKNKKLLSVVNTKCI